MNITAEQSADGLNIKLAGALLITDVAEVKSALSALLPNAQLVIDLSLVEKLDTAGLQLLLLLKKECGERLHLVQHSDAVRRTMELCNVTQYFGDPIVLPAHDGAAHE